MSINYKASAIQPPTISRKHRNDTNMLQLHVGSHAKTTNTEAFGLPSDIQSTIETDDEIWHPTGSEPNTESHADHTSYPKSTRRVTVDQHEDVVNLFSTEEIDKEVTIVRPGGAQYSPSHATTTSKRRGKDKLAPNPSMDGSENLEPKKPFESLKKRDDEGTGWPYEALQSTGQSIMTDESADIEKASQHVKSSALTSVTEESRNETESASPSQLDFLELTGSPVAFSVSLPDAEDDESKDTIEEEFPNPFDYTPPMRHPTHMRNYSTPDIRGTRSISRSPQRLPSVLRPAHPRSYDTAGTRRASLALPRIAQFDTMPSSTDWRGSSISSPLTDEFGRLRLVLPRSQSAPAASPSTLPNMAAPGADSYDPEPLIPDFSAPPHLPLLNFPPDEHGHQRQTEEFSTSSQTLQRILEGSSTEGEQPQPTGAQAPLGITNRTVVRPRKDVSADTPNMVTNAFVPRHMRSQTEPGATIDMIPGQPMQYWSTGGFEGDKEYIKKRSKWKFWSKGRDLLTFFTSKYNMLTNILK
ncbi:hypothetical protein BU17DRAFT_59804 [Hysterangium stoloniferum]|nr:hypothetical protein BU17DRAFT_59804 [Hysterangium stoloniferum]